MNGGEPNGAAPAPGEAPAEAVADAGGPPAAAAEAPLPDVPPPEAPEPPAARPRGPRLGRWRRHLVGALLGTAYLAALLATAKDVGFSRDEGFYFTAADEYQNWLDLLLKDRREAMKPQTIARYWGVNSEHPPLMKVLFGLSHRAFHDPKAAVWIAAGARQILGLEVDSGGRPLGLLAPSTSYRLPGMLCGSALVYLVFIFAAKRLGELEGMLAAAFLALMPPFFYHSHLDAFDVAVSLAVFATVYAFEKSLRSNLWAVLTGVFFGVALLTKLNAFFIPPTLLVVWALRDLVRPAGSAILLVGLPVLVVAAGFHKYSLLFAAACFLAVFVKSCGMRGGQLQMPRIPTAFFWMALLGPLMLWGLWPWLWHETWKHFTGYVSFHSNHDYYNIAYFGVNYFRPPLPMSYPFGTTALTTPVVTLAAAALGMALAIRYWLLTTHAGLCASAAAPAPAASGWRRRLRAFPLRPWRSRQAGPPPDDSVSATLSRNPGLGTLLAVNALVPMMIIAHPKVYIFGGTKHWMPAWPFIAIFAGMGLAWSLRHLATAISDRLARRGSGRLRVGARSALVGALAVLCLAPAVQGTAQSHPFGLSHYNLLAGGVPGAADLGMCRQFWGFTTGSLLPWLNANVPRNGAVYFHDTAWDSYRMFQTDGSLRKDIRWAGGPESAVVSLVHHEMHMAEVEHWIWQVYGTPNPVHVLTHEGVPIISVYAKPGTTLGYTRR